jgi:hypothetical protein
MLTANRPVLQPFVDALVRVAEREGYSMHPRYGGRAMFGAHCLGMSHGRTSGFDIALEVVAEMIEYGGDDHDKLIDAIGEVATLTTKQDNLGRDTIIYWEDLEVTGDLPDDEEDDE